MDDYVYQVDQFADIRILRFHIPGFDDLTLKQKTLLYCLSQAALCGRDIIWDQNYRNNLLVRYVLENIYKNYNGDREESEFLNFEEYLKRIWFSNGIHHHYSTDKILPGFSSDYFKKILLETNWKHLPNGYNDKESLYNNLFQVLFDPSFDGKRVNQQAGSDLVLGSANNYYEGINQEEAERFYQEKIQKGGSQPVSFGLNSKLVKEKTRVYEKIWKIDGMYSDAIEQIVSWLKRALPFTDTDIQRDAIRKLIDFYSTGDLKDFDDYNILWLKDQGVVVDFVNGFIETYGDPLGFKGSWESLVNFKDEKATRRTELISNNAQWFEDHSPVDNRFRKKNVKGVTAKVINAVQLGGDCYPVTPIGINLPNADWIRRDYGSKSVTIENITHAYHMASIESGFIEEFAHSQEEIQLAREFGFLADNVHTDLHECVGHGSGQMLEGVTTEVLKNYYSPLEEARADLYALYFIMDNKMLGLGILRTLNAATAQYNSYIRNGLMTQLARIEPGKNIEQAHMRCRQLIALWCYQQGKKDSVIEKIRKDNKTFLRINDYGKLRTLFGELLAEIQRIKSEGDYEAAKYLVESYGIRVDRELHTEVLSRYRKLKLAPYSGFINPKLVPVYEKNEIVDVMTQYPGDYASQMMEYSSEYGFLSPKN
jgi:dipeptidyl-peptidase III